MKLARLSYSQPTISGGQVVQGKTWYVSHLPGDGGVDWGYTDDPAKAILVGPRAVSAFRKLHGSRVNVFEVDARPETMKAGEINRELDALDAKSGTLCDEFIAAGRGHETNLETLGKNDPLALRFREISDRRHALRNEIERRTGERMSRLPKGFGPIKVLHRIRQQQKGG